MGNVFLSHTTSDEDLAHEVADQLRREIDHINVFVSSEPDGIPKGDWLQHVLRQLDSAEVLITLITPLSEKSIWVAFEYGYFWGQKNKEDIYILYHPKAEIPNPLNTIQGKSVISPEELNVFFTEICDRFDAKYRHQADIQVIVEKANSLNYETAAEREHKAKLISQMANSPNVVALDAVQELRRLGWLTDGSLEGQVFTGAKLQGAQLQEAKLRGVKLNHADLREADITYADLREADLGGSDFQKISPNSLRAATFWYANLENASFGSAKLRDAEFGGANLKGANFNGARWQGMRTNENTQFDENTILYDGSKWTADIDVKQLTRFRPEVW